MDNDDVSRRLHHLLTQNLEPENLEWLEERVNRVVEDASGKELFLTYSLVGRKISGSGVAIEESGTAGPDGFLGDRAIRKDQLARIYLLSAALEANPDYFVPKVSTLIQVADTGELVTFLTFLPLLPQPQSFLQTAVEALRTNIATVFDAIALNNPYPREQFNQQQWNQMYLKAAFMGRDLLQISGVEQRANADLARIISDYAHERWAASRSVDPQIWRPVGPFLDQTLLADMERLLSSPDIREQKAGYLSCLASESDSARELIREHPLRNEYESDPFDWKDITV